MRKVIEAVKQDSTELDEVLEKNKQYRKYIQNHVRNVEKSFSDYFLPLLDMKNLSDKIQDKDLHQAIVRAKTNIQSHDASKYDEIEFEPYRLKYYPTEQEKQDPDYLQTVEYTFKTGWQHHYQNNKHHPDHWATEDLSPYDDMPLEYIIEMLCDWLAMGIFKKSSTLDWFENQAEKEKGCMTDNTLSFVTEFLYRILPKVKKVP